jgi:predicted subunit of tRNA(5-methylaminomethyl-2-thiouridylate) methyltransferase
MELGLLFSAGKDSTLAGVLLEEFYEITAVTVDFGITDDWRHARDAADALGWPFERLELDRSHAERAVETMSQDGYPRNGIQYVHEQALEHVATERFDAIADGTRRDDRVPSLSRSEAQSLEDRHDIAYLTPLAGIGREAIDYLAETTLSVTTGPSQDIDRADYEADLRALLGRMDTGTTVQEVFPEHDQSRVTGWAPDRSTG